jgi:hypothetical protein
MKHPPLQVPALQYSPLLPQLAPSDTVPQTPSLPPVLLPRQEWQAWPQALSQHTPSGAHVVPAAQPPPAVSQVWPCLLLQAPVLSQVPAQTPGSSWLFTALQTRPVQVWHSPAQSLRVTHPTHWLVAVSHVLAAPVQCLFAVQATHKPLLVAQAGAPDRPAQSLSPAHLAH